jgi:hypothetical protein
MKHAQTLTTLLLAGTLLFPAGLLAGPKAKPLKAPELSPHLTFTEHICRARGAFVYNRAIERDNGSTLTDALLDSRQWDEEHTVPEATRAVHDLLLRALHTMPWSAPALERQAAELVCLGQVQQTTAPAPATVTKPQDIRY